MTLTFDRAAYTDLLSQITPKVIETEEEYEATLAIVEFLAFNQNRTTEQTALYKLLVLLVEAYEEEHYSITEASPVEVLNHILEASDTQPIDLVGLLGSSRAVSEIIDGNRAINKAEAKILANRFNVSPSLLVDDAQFIEQYQQAVEAANQASAIEPQVVSVHYDDINRLIVICLNSGASFSFPPDIAQGLADASPEDLAAVEITPSGMGLHWENLDADFSVSGLLSGCFGSRTWMATLQNHLQSQPIRPKMPRDNKRDAMTKLWAPNPSKVQAKLSGNEASSKVIE